MKSAILRGVDARAIDIRYTNPQSYDHQPTAARRELTVRVTSSLVACERRPPLPLPDLDLPERGDPALDLAVALHVTGIDPDTTGAIGELSLMGEIRPVRGALARVEALRDAGCTHVIVPHDCAIECGYADRVVVLPARSLSDVVNHFTTLRSLTPQPPTPIPDFPTQDVQLTDPLLEVAREALRIIERGEPVLLVGNPGQGRTLVGRALARMLDPMLPGEALDTLRVQSAAGLWSDTRALGERPFRAPHHSISEAGMFGGGTPPRPGEVSLAHNGVLFLDEAPVFRRPILEALSLVYANGRSPYFRIDGESIDFPAQSSLVLATNPCLCGYRGPVRLMCRCSDKQVDRYLNRIPAALRRNQVRIGS